MQAEDNKKGTSVISPGHALMLFSYVDHLTHETAHMWMILVPTGCEPESSVALGRGDKLFDVLTCKGGQVGPENRKIWMLDTNFRADALTSAPLYF